VQTESRVELLYLNYTSLGQQSLLEHVLTAMSTYLFFDERLECSQCREYLDLGFDRKRDRDVFYSSYIKEK
jgi:hypothetical protein